MLVLALTLAAMVLAGCTSTAPTETDPAEEAGVTYEVFPPTSRFGKSPRLILRNSGQVPLEYRRDDFLLEVLYEGAWRTVQTPADPDYACGSPSAGLVLHPGDITSQRITACNLDGHPGAALFPGAYRVTQTVLTIPSEPDEAPVEIDKVVEFKVAEPVGDVPGPDECDVLCISDTHVEPGQTVRVSFAPPRRYVWGIVGELHAGTAQTIWPVAFLYGGVRDGELVTYWIGKAPAYNDIDFYGPHRWRWKVPALLEPGIYSFVKDGIAGSVRIPIEDRTTIWAVSFEVEKS